MHPIQLASVFFALTCCFAVFGGEVFSQKSSSDVLKFNLPSRAKMSAFSKRRFRRSSEDKDAVNTNLDEGVCNNPTRESGHDIKSYSWFFVNETRLSISMAWIGKGSGKTSEAKSLLLLATTELGIFLSLESALYKSTDFGKSFHRINAQIFETHLRKDAGIMKSPVNPNKVILVSYSNPFFSLHKTGIVRTLNGGITWAKHSAPFQITGPLLFHPRQENWILARGSIDGKAYLSKDFGMTWKFLQSYVKNLKWGARTDRLVEKEEKTILMTVASDLHSFLMSDLILLRSRDLGEHFESIHVKHVYTFGLQGPFLFVSIDYNRNNNTRIMHVSKDGGDSWDPVQVPTVTPERFYSILDMSEGMIFLHVDEPGDTGKGILYTSDADGIVYSESLKDHMFTNLGGVTDFYRVQSMRGTYLTSRMNSDNSLSSLISHDRGGEWKPLPLTPEQCKDVKLKLNEKCSLHIHNRFSASRGVPIPMGPLSVGNAVGIIIAHGNAGTALTRRTDVWMTRDGGYSWYKVLDGSHHYSIGDHGNLIVAVPAYETTSKYLMYSVNEGRCWFKYKYTDHDFHVVGLVTEPGAKTMLFSLWGFTLPTRAWQVVTVDFKNLLQRPCTTNDYEAWVPHAEGNTKGCLLGKKTTIKRPKKESLCFNGIDYTMKQSSKCCKCTQADMECDYGYIRNKNQKCVLSDDSPPQLCLNGDVRKLQNDLGYRLLPGDTCCDGSADVRRYLDTHQICKNVSWYEYGMNYKYEAKNDRKGKGNKALFVVIPLSLIFLIAVAYFARKYWLLEKFSPSYRYSQLPQEDDDNMEGSDAFKYNPRPKGLREYRDCDTDDDDTTMIDI